MQCIVACTKDPSPNFHLNRLLLASGQVQPVRSPEALEASCISITLAWQIDVVNLLEKKTHQMNIMIRFVGLRAGYVYDFLEFLGFHYFFRVPI